MKQCFFLFLNSSPSLAFPILLTKPVVVKRIKEMWLLGGDTIYAVMICNFHPSIFVDCERRWAAGTGTLIVCGWQEELWTWVQYVFYMTLDRLYAR